MRPILTVNVIDEVNPVVKNLLQNNATFMRRVTKSVGWWMQSEIKKGIKSGAPGGSSFKKRTPYRRVRAKLVPHAPTAWYGKMRQAIGYEYKGMGSVVIGWTSRTSAMYGDMQEHGATRQVTAKVQKKYAAAGVPLKKSAIKLPARPVFDPMTTELRAKAPSYIEEKVAEYVAGNVAFGKKNRREYKVYSK